MSRKRCAFMLADGSRCGLSREANDPKFCIAHSGNRAPSSTQFKPNPQTNEPDTDVIVRQLLRDKDPAIRLRAVEMFEKRQTAAAAGTSQKRDHRALVNALTSVEHEILKFATSVINAVKTTHGVKTDSLPLRTLSSEARDGLQSMLDAVPQELIEAAAPDGSYLHPREATDEEMAAYRASQQPRSPSAARQAAPRQESPLPTARDWAKAGLFTLEGGTRVTHVRGDEHADKILSGEIPYEDAVAEEQFHQKQLARMRRSE